MKQLQTVLTKFNSVVALNKDVQISYFRNGLKSFIRIQLDIYNQDFDIWNELLEKAIDTNAIASYQPSLETYNISA